MGGMSVACETPTGQVWWTATSARSRLTARHEFMFDEPQSPSTRKAMGRLGAGSEGLVGFSGKGITTAERGEWITVSWPILLH